MKTFEIIAFAQPGLGLGLTESLVDYVHKVKGIVVAPKVLHTHYLKGREGLQITNLEKLKYWKQKMGGRGRLQQIISSLPPHYTGVVLITVHQLKELHNHLLLIVREEP